MKLSIIIPYFKTLNLTKILINLLLPQLTNEVEIILIDDGCFEKEFDKFEKENIRVIHQENMGVAKTRNKGIDLAKGEYIAFIDCDDIIMSDYVNSLIEAINKYHTDIINFNWIDKRTNKIYRKPKNFAPWKAIYKKDRIPRFYEDKKYGSEDVWFQAEIEKNPSITYLDKVLYMYNSNREGSLMWEKKHNK